MKDKSKQDEVKARKILGPFTNPGENLDPSTNPKRSLETQEKIKGKKSREERKCAGYIQRNCRSNCNAGKSKITTGYELLGKYWIHTEDLRRKKDIF